MGSFFKSLESWKRMATLVSFTPFCAWMNVRPSIQGFACSLAEASHCNYTHISMPFMVFLVKYSWVMETPPQRLQGSRIKPQSRVGRYLLYCSKQRYNVHAIVSLTSINSDVINNKSVTVKTTYLFGRTEGDYGKISPEHVTALTCYTRVKVEANSLQF